jgi:hypothetical protein
MADAVDLAQPRQQGWGSWAVSVAATGVGAVSSAAYTLTTGGGGQGDGSHTQSTPAISAALRELAAAVENVSVAADPTAEPTAEAMLELVYDLVVPSLHDCLECGLRPPAGWLPPNFGRASAKRSVWELFTPLPPRAAGTTHDEGYFDSLKKTVGFVQEEVVQWRAEHGLEHEAAIPRIDGEPEGRGAPHEFVVLIAMGLQEGVLGKWLRVVLGDATHVARHYESDAALLCDSGTAQRVIELAESLDALQLGGLADEDGGRRTGRTQQGLPTEVDEVLGPALAAYEAEETIRLIRGEPASEHGHAADQGSVGESARPPPVIVLLDEDEPITVASPKLGKGAEQEEGEEAEEWSCQPCSPPVEIQPAPEPEPEPEPEQEQEPEPEPEPEEAWSCQPCLPPVEIQSAPESAPEPTTAVDQLTCQPCTPSK